MDSVYDDTNISPVKWNNFNSYDLASIVYQKDNSIYLFTKENTMETNELLLKSSDTVRYYSPTATYSRTYKQNSWQTVLNLSAIQTDIFNNRKIVVLERNLSTNHDSTYIVDEGAVNNPQYQFADYDRQLTYEKITNGKSLIYSYNDYSNGPSLLTLNDSLDGDFTNLQTENSPRPIIDIFNKRSYINFFPYTYNFRKDNISSIFIYRGFNTTKDTMFITKVKKPAVAVELLGYFNHEINYAVWEDSLDVNIKLFVLRVDPFFPDGITQKNVPDRFILSQNYPNPFNPTTTIKYSIPNLETRHASSLHVTLKVYDILGREVATLVNEEKPPGNYKVTFDASHTEHGQSLASGVYLYRLQAGSFNETKKLILLK